MSKIYMNITPYSIRSTKSPRVNILAAFLSINLAMNQKITRQEIIKKSRNKKKVKLILIHKSP